MARILDGLIRIFQSIGLAFHKLTHSHCEHCRVLDEEQLDRDEDNRVCLSCERLALLLEQEKAEKKRLLDIVLDDKVETQSETPFDPRPVGPRFTSQRVLREQLTKKYRVVPKTEEVSSDKSIEELEDELGVKEDASGQGN